MKLIIAIVRDIDSDLVSQVLTSHEYRVTGIASTGGFLRRGNTTLLIGVEDYQLEEALQLIRSTIAEREGESGARGVVFVVKVDQFDHF